MSPDLSSRLRHSAGYSEDTSGPGEQTAESPRGNPSLAGEPTLHAPAKLPPGIGLEPGQDLGPYRLVSLLGEGGMGVVFKAEQRSPIQRLVALKIIRPGLDTPSVIARFEAERQALAMMNHPGIARVYEAGATAAGRPYFAMEFVPGEPITSYCDRHKLTIRQRLALFRDVCDAVQHAHTKGVIHRDLKAANVLVTEAQDKPVPKVIDFGVAKALHGRLIEQTLFTETGQLIGTPAYMSPEQAGSGGLDVDTRTDIYSLGVLLYELLTGALPFDATQLRGAAYGEIQRIIREEEPPRPSTHFSRRSPGSLVAAERRAARVEELAQQLRRELEWIPLMAMRKERGQRYESASQLAHDVGNYLEGRPLLAGPESQWYRVRKAMRRHRAAVGAAAGVALALLLGLAGMSWQAWRATQAERVADAARIAAEDRAARHAASANFLYRVLAGVDPGLAQGRDTTLLLDMLARAEAGLEKDLPDPGARAGMQHMLGDLYRKLGERARAGRLLEQGVTGARQALSAAVARGRVADHDFEAARNVVQGCQRYSLFLRQGEDKPAAEQLAREALAVVADHMPEEDPERAFAEAGLAAALYDNDKVDEAEPLARSAHDRMTRQADRFTPVQRAECASTLASIRYARGELREAEQAYAQAAAMFQAAGADRTRSFADLTLNRSVVAYQLNEDNEAFAHIDAVHQLREAIGMQALHPDRRNEWNVRSRILERLRRPADAAEALHNAIRIQEALGPPADPAAASRSALRLGGYYREAGDEAAAAQWEERAREYEAAGRTSAATGGPPSR